MNFFTVHTIAVVVVVLMTAVVALLDAVVVTDCPKVTPMDGFKLNKTIGVWHVMQVSKNDDDTMENVKCLRETNYIDENGVFKINLEEEPKGSTDIVSNIHTATPMDGNEATLFLEAPKPVKGINATIIDTDYNTYLIRLACYITQTGYDLEVMSKQKTPITDDFRQKVQTIITNAKISVTLIDINQDDCN